MSSENLVSRRSFIKKSTLLSAGVVGSTVLSSCAPKTQSESKSDLSWDKEVDVVVVGSGTVAVAAIAAASTGASVIVLEKGPFFGGTTSISGGGMWIPNNYSMEANGISDSKEEASEYIHSIAEGQSTDELIDTYVEKAPEMLTFLRDTMGAEFAGSPAPAPYQDYYNLPGSKEFGRTVYIVTEEGGSGGVLMEAVRNCIDDLGVEVMLETAGTKLVTDREGAVIGIIAKDGNEEIAIKANKGVILGTGGFDFNKDMVTGFLRGPIFTSVSVRTNTGDGHIMGMELGADLRNMNESWGVPSFVLDEEELKGEADWQMYRGKPGAIVVNKYGERIGNEACPYEQFQRSFYYYDSGRYEWRNTPSFCIFDGSFLEHYPLPGSNYQVGVVPEWMVQADTLEELAEKLGIDWEGFQATLEVFNANAKEGIDPIWLRGEAPFDLNTAGDATREDLANPCLAPIENGPFLGAPYYPGTCGTSGGLRVNGKAQVMNVRGEVIPGLYATGNTMGGAFGASYPGGGSTLGQGMTFGYIAGMDAAGRQLAE